MRVEPFRGMPIRISPAAPVLPANILRFYLDFQRSGEAHFDRSRLRLSDEAGRAIPDPFLVLSQELWSQDGRRLTILMEPGRIKRGMGDDPSHQPALMEGRRYCLELFDPTARHVFKVGERVSTPLDEASWRVTPPAAGGREALVIDFDRVMDAALCVDEIATLDPSGEPVPVRVSLDPDGKRARLVPERSWSAGPHRLLFSARLEDVCGNRLGEALDNGLLEGVRPRSGGLAFTPR